MENVQVSENFHRAILKYNLIMHSGCRGLFSSCLSHLNEETANNHLFHSFNQLFS